MERKRFIYRNELYSVIVAVGLISIAGCYTDYRIKKQNEENRKWEVQHGISLEKKVK